ncbi:MAG TPA: TrbI/VirB10 family protein [Sphingomonas sp.]|nr:TrbI/VirB10 family protein [Sphingomonas sp.]
MAPAVAAAADDGAGTIASPPPPLALPADFLSEPSSAQTQPFPASPPMETAALAPDDGAYVAPPRRFASRAQTDIDPDTLAGMRIAAGHVTQEQAPLAPAFDERNMPPRAPGADGRKADERVEAGRFANPSTTVPKGTVIQAVLETALDSTRAGLARAIISRDVYSFDGSKVLVPKGSRLIGDYKADLAGGQNRALIQWQRLMRPDGVVVNIDSPSADPLGRAGVKGEVNAHFIERFGGAILQSVLNIGTQVGVSKISSGSVVYAIPLTTQSVPVISQDKIAPTLTVRQGSSVSVFVAKDLDFTAVEP